MQNTKCESMYTPKTYDAVYFGGHYKDPRVIVLRLKCAVFVSACAGAIALPVLMMIH